MVDPLTELERMVKLKIKGVKLQPTVQKFIPDESKMFKIYEKVSELIVILAHLGGYQIWDEISILTEFNNAYFDTSCVVGEMPIENLES